MNNPETAARGRRRIGGIKFSSELVQFNFSEPSGSGVRAAHFFSRMAEHRINMPFVCLGVGARGNLNACCAAAEDGNAIRSMLAGAPELAPHVEIIAPVGALTLFPHRSCLGLLGQIMAVFGDTGLPVYGIGTSISTITVTTDYRLMERAVDRLGTVLELPEDHAPFQPGFKITQIKP